MTEYAVIPIVLCSMFFIAQCFYATIRHATIIHNKTLLKHNKHFVGWILSSLI